MLNSNPLELIYNNEDPDTYLHYNGTGTTPELLVASSNIGEHTHRKIIDDPGSVTGKIIDDPGSGHKPVIASITIGRKSMTTKVPTKLSWNFKKADWPRFTNLLENELHTSHINFNQHPDKLCTDPNFNQHPDKLCNDIDFNQHPDKLCTDITLTNFALISRIL
ncbi:unnamed protein product [Rodentolepis nana]|uniref:Endo/exonuclease/phosphatase domain-containing protein n=1 Tax=Rodentolepis nana TaxID=102285 RepID=A0A0R3TH65_RODNA|nr:unnamed protein product [Rodentolepis nana]